MDTQFILCTSCKTRLKLPSSITPGKKVKCPKCAQLVTVPALAADDPGYEVVNEKAARAAQKPTTLAPAMKSCSYCGEQVFAVGNPQGLGWTYTKGVVSALREHDYGPRKVKVVQTDTRIGPGNSGGGLYNQKGDLIGINTFVVGSSPSSAGETGLGFAIRKSVLVDLKPDVLQTTVTSGNP